VQNWRINSIKHDEIVGKDKAFTPGTEEIPRWQIVRLVHEPPFA
jgi:hypothetical protein